MCYQHAFSEHGIHWLRVLRTSCWSIATLSNSLSALKDAKVLHKFFFLLIFALESRYPTDISFDSISLKDLQLENLEPLKVFQSMATEWSYIGTSILTIGKIEDNSSS